MSFAPVNAISIATLSNAIFAEIAKNSALAMPSEDIYKVFMRKGYDRATIGIALSALLADSLSMDDNGQLTIGVNDFSI